MSSLVSIKGWLACTTTMSKGEIFKKNLSNHDAFYGFFVAFIYFLETFDWPSYTNQNSPQLE